MNLKAWGRSFTKRRSLNWIPLALTYSCMYMGRFNFNLVKSDIGLTYHLDKAEMGLIAACGFWTYALSVAINGSIIDRLGGRRGIIVGAIGSAILNAVIGFFPEHSSDQNSYTPQYALVSKHVFSKLGWTLDCQN